MWFRTTHSHKKTLRSCLASWIRLMILTTMRNGGLGSNIIWATSLPLYWPFRLSLIRKITAECLFQSRHRAIIMLWVFFLYLDMAEAFMPSLLSVQFSTRCKRWNERESHESNHNTIWLTQLWRPCSTYEEGHRTACCLFQVPPKSSGEKTNSPSPLADMHTSVVKVNVT